MCNKISVTSEPEILERRFGAHYRADYIHKAHFHANGYAHPALPVITQKYPDEIIPFEWGLIPSFCKTAAEANTRRKGNLNSRDDKVFSSNMWRGSIYKKRCLVLADGFFESMDVSGLKIPHFIYRKDKEPFAFAGIYNVWKDESGTQKETFSIVTTEPNELLRKIHNITLRMPVILPRELERRWLQPDLLDDEIKDLMQPLEDGILVAHPVSKLINQNKLPNNEPFILDEVHYPELT